MVARWQNRALDEDYLHELGQLIHEQVTAHRALLEHQRSHPQAA
jgi:hypothetical protein